MITEPIIKVGIVRYNASLQSYALTAGTPGFSLRDFFEDHYQCIDLIIEPRIGKAEQLPF